VRGHRDGENPARWRGHLDKVFAARAKVRQVRHHAAMPIDDMPGLYSRLREAKGTAALALRFVILTAGRASEIAGSVWPEIDRPSAIWTVPGRRMKGGRDHRVALSREGMAVLKQAAELRVDKFIFPGGRSGRPLSLTALTKALRAAGGADATVHGFRSTFKDWASERTSFPSEVSEMALAHAIGDRVEAAYRRGELLRKRAIMMEAWSAFLTKPASAKVVQLERRQA
jgi:integrase